MVVCGDWRRARHCRAMREACCRPLRGPGLASTPRLRLPPRMGIGRPASPVAAIPDRDPPPSGHRSRCGIVAHPQPGAFREMTRHIPRDRTVSTEQRYRVHDPVAEVDLGETFVVETINFRTPVIRTPVDANPAVYREREETGPIFIKGVQPGDVLAIHIEDIQPVGHASGGWWEDPKVASFLPIEEDRVLFPGGLWAPRQMMIGDIYTTPATAATPNPWDNGGNMDFKDIAAGHVLCLKAELAGGLLVFGDVHAAQGDGEILGLAAECAADVTLRITKDQLFRSERPLVSKSASFVSLACRHDYVEARDLAVQDATRLLGRIAGCTEQEAYLFVTTVGDLRNGAVWPMGKHEIPLVVGVEVPMAGIKPSTSAGWPRTYRTDGGSGPCTGRTQDTRGEKRGLASAVGRASRRWRWLTARSGTGFAGESGIPLTPAFYPSCRGRGSGPDDDGADEVFGA